MHNAGMRTHSTIVRDAGAAKIALLTGKPIFTVRSWQQRDSIPSDQWVALTDAGYATLEELAEAAANKVKAA